MSDDDTTARAVQDHPEIPDTASSVPGGKIARRSLLLGGSAAGVGLVSAAAPAGAADGGAVELGENNTASASTEVTTTKGSGLMGATSENGDPASASGNAGVHGSDTSSGGANGVAGHSVAGNGVAGFTSGDNNSGVYGDDTSTGGGYGIYGRSTKGTGVHGTTTAKDKYGTVGVDASTDGAYGVYGSSTAGIAVYGTTAAGGGNAGVYGANTNTEDNYLGAYGVYGSSSALGGVGVGGVAPAQEGIGVSGSASGSGGVGVFGTASGSDGIGVYGQTTANGDPASPNGNAGVYGSDASSGGANGVTGNSIAGNGVAGFTAGDNNSGVYGDDTSSGGGYGVYGASTNGTALYADGNCHVSGTLSKGSGSFKIDHPLDPSNKYLYHSFVESPDMMNVYNGNVVLDEAGRATVELPEWFEALNRDFRYQLTAIGGFAPIYVSKKIAQGCFEIAGGEAGLEVSWQVTGIRHDAFANAHRIVVEEDKSSQDRGCYLHPELFGSTEHVGSVARAHARRRPVPRSPYSTM
jgi:hypothetical protein